MAAEVQRIAFKGKQEILVDTDQTSRDFLDKVIQRAIEKPETLADHLEADIYSQLPEMLKRVTRVRPLTIGKMIPERLARRYREAVRSYVSGNPIACCALCRAVLEVTLKEEWGRRFPGRLNTDSIRLAEMIDKWDGTQRLSEDLLALCRKIKDNGNNAVHGDALLKSNEALESLAATQQVLKNLFA